MISTDLLPIREQLTRIEKKLDNKFNNRWLDLKAASKYCDLSPQTLMRYNRSGQLKSSKSTGKLMFKAEWLDKWLNG